MLAFVACVIAMLAGLGASPAKPMHQDAAEPAARRPEYLSDVLRDWRAAKKAGDPDAPTRGRLAERGLAVAELARGRERYEALRFVAKLDEGASSARLVAARDLALERVVTEYLDDGDLLGECVLRVLRDDAHERALLERIFRTTSSPAVRAACELRPVEGLLERALADGEITGEERVRLLAVLQRIEATYGAAKHPLSARTWAEFCAGVSATVRDLVLLGEPAPEIAGVDARGQAVRLSGLLEKPVLVAFWGDWCEPCRALYARQRGLSAKGRLALFGVNSDPDRARAAAVIAQERLDWPNLWDGPEGTSGAVATRWRVRAWPSWYLLDARGIVRGRWRGAPSEGELERALADCTLKAR